MASSSQTRRWYHWYSPSDSPQERKLILKLDLLIVPYAFIVYWVKYIDQSNINNAYVSGLKEELGFNSNELVHLQTIYILGAVLGQIPFAFLFTKVPMYLLIPGLDFGWGIFTLLQYRVESYSELMAYRFMVGLFEAAYFPGVHYIFGSWYRGDEIGRRGGFFYVGLTLGTLTAGLIQAGASARLDGVHGLSGWRWMFIITAIITLPLGILGFFIWPGTPDKPNKLVLNHRDISLAKARLQRAGHSTSERFSFQTVKRVFTTPQIYVLIIWDIFFWNGSINTSTGGYLLWLKSLHRYTPSHLNELGTIAPALGIFYVLFICFGSDLFLGRAGAITLAHTWNLIGLIILIVWQVPESSLWFAFSTTYSAVAMSSVLYGWVNDILKYSPAERSFTLIVINAVSQSTTAWTPLLVFKTVEGPRFTKGYSFVAANAICLIAFTQVVRILHNRQEKRIESTRYLDEDFNSSNTEETLSGVQTPNLIFEIPPEKATAA